MKNLKHLYILIGTIIFVSTSLYSNVQSNYLIIDSLLSNASVQINSKLDEKSDNKNILMNFNSHSAVWLLRQKIFKHLESRGVSIYQTEIEEKKYLKADIFIHECDVRFSNTEEDRNKLIRRIKVKISGIITEKDGLAINLPEIDYEYKDILDRDDIPLVQSNQFDFAHSPVPDAPKSFFREIAEPFIIIASAALIVVLFFTVRSG